jgi:hypothetical protein
VNKQKREKLKLMLRQWPVNGLCTATTLRALGISTSLLHHYVQQHWVEQVTRGVYRRPGDTPGWPAVLQAVQRETGLPIHAGGLTALELHGYGHYASWGRPLFFYSPKHVRLPAWVKSAMNREVRFVSTDFLGHAPRESLHSMKVEDVTITVSVPERAVLEMLYRVPRQVGFDEAFEVAATLFNLRVELMQTLLEGCASVKAKRLFLYCARESGFSWFKALDRNRINLGAGNREIVKGGKFDKEFLLTVAVNPFATEVQF